VWWPIVHRSEIEPHGRHPRGTPHAIAKIRPSAGRHPRASVGGFLKKKGIALDQPLTPWTM